MGAPKSQALRKGLFALAAVTAGAITLWALRGLITRDMLAGHRPEYHALRILLVADIWRSGDVIPRWVPELAGGLGYPLFIYYGWLAYALAAPLALLGLGPSAALNAVTIAAALAQAAGAWKLGRELGGRAGGFIVWTLFAFAPYQLANLYVRANYPELVAGSLAPWAVLCMVRTVAGRGRGNLLACAVLLAAMALCHNISGLTLGATVGAAGLVVAFTLPRSERKGGAAKAALACIAGALLCCFFWLPVLAGRGYVHLANDFHHYLDYREHFLYLHQLFSTAWGYGYSLPGPNDTMPLQLGLPQIATLVILAPVALALARRSSPRGSLRLLGFVLAGLVLAFLTTQLSAPLWSIATPLAVLQFPWRLHLPGTLMIAIAGALAVRVLAAPRWRRFRSIRIEVLLVACASLGIAATSLRYCRPLTTYPSDEASVRKPLTLGYYTTAIADEFRPVWATDLPELGRLMRTEHAALDGVELPHARLPQAAERGHFSLHTQSDHAGELRIPIFWFPGWSASIDGQSQQIYPCAGTGLLCTRLPAGSHALTAAWEPTPIYDIGVIISVLTLAALALAAVKKRRSPEPEVLSGNTLD